MMTVKVEIAKAMRLLVAVVLGYCNAAADAAEGDARNVTDRGEIKRHTADFEQGLAHLGIRGRLRCSMMIELVAPIRDRSFGAICNFEGGDRPRTIMLCDDTMIGKLTVKAYGFTIVASELIAFTKFNCPGGG